MRATSSWRLQHAVNAQQGPSLAGSRLAPQAAGWALQQPPASQPAAAASQARSLAPRAGRSGCTALTRFTSAGLTVRSAAHRSRARTSLSSSQQTSLAATLLPAAGRHIRRASAPSSLGWLQQLPHHSPHQVPAAALDSQQLAEPTWQQVLAGQLAKAPCVPSQHSQLQQQPLQLARPIKLPAPSIQAPQSANSSSSRSSSSVANLQVPEVFYVPESARDSLVLYGLQKHLGQLGFLDGVIVYDLASISLSHCLGSGTYAEVNRISCFPEGADVRLHVVCILYAWLLQ